MQPLLLLFASLSMQILVANLSWPVLTMHRQPMISIVALLLVPRQPAEAAVVAVMVKSYYSQCLELEDS